MIGLLAKDLMVIRTYFKQLMIALVVFIPLSFASPGVMGSMLAILLPMTVITSMSYDDFYHWHQYTRAMPLKPNTAVMEKYVMLILFECIAAFLGCVAALVFLLIRRQPLTEILIMWKSMAMVAGVSLILYSIALPVIFRLGVEKGRLALMAIFVVPSILMVSAGDWMKKLYVLVNGWNRLKWFLPAAVVLIIAVVEASYLISCRIYRRKEE
ncbi:ABC-2 transporter permease [Diplocloster modestus]|uniref:ABC-2 transporter permease n=1 Tax=Diplocloster modestus TaxID=2850322 RepID=A0ABS6KEB2_9FIRM|nr:ABC-2 transporter permease [Diplocloster modestus]MBU9728839.1 ABC-2 transporter permease [Diplocloster modestus]